MEQQFEPRHRLHYLYVLSDFLISFIFSLLIFFPLAWIKQFDIDASFLIASLIFAFVVSIIVVVSFFVAGIYKMMIRHFGLPEAIKMVIILLVIGIIELVTFILIRSLTSLFDGVSVFSLLLCVLTISLVVPATRLYARFKTLIAGNRKKNVRTLVIGAGAVAKFIADEIYQNKKNRNLIVAFVDDDPNKIGKTFANRPIYGPVSNIAEIIEKHSISEVIIAINNLTDERKKQILKYLSSSPVRVKKVPVIADMSGPYDRKIVDINIDELLGRDKVILDNNEINQSLSDKVVLVTGAGGSIGSELVRQIFSTKPRVLVLFDIYENSTYDIEQELKTLIRQKANLTTKLITLIGSTYDEATVEHLFKKYHPDYVYHAAAYKHVPLMEDSPAEAIRTNIVGTYNVAKMADKYSAKKMVLISTDKAVRPTNVMGATKRFAEMIIQNFSSCSKNTIYAAVRFGNVLGSNGSVVPLFEKQIEQGGPITITDRNIIRYFMSIPEAVSLVLQCGLFAKGGEIFILDMGEPVKIIDLAYKMIRQAGLVPEKDIQIVETGLRPGEKLFEELLIDDEHHEKTPNHKIFIEKKNDIYPIEEEIKSLKTAFGLDDNEEIKALLAEAVDTYQRKKNA